VNLLKSAVQDELRALPDSGRLAPLPRCSAIYAQGQPGDALYLIEDGLVKLTRTNPGKGKIVLSICGPGQLIGEEALSEAPRPYHTEALTITPATLHRVPREPARNFVANSGAVGSVLVAYLLERKLELAQKVELLCLHDVEHRILYYLAELSALLPPTENGNGHPIPITQLELADLIGATRETTSTTLNQLERKGLLKLSRRLLTIPTPQALREAALARLVPPAVAAAVAEQ
jgi:CRP/FNR family transcriptional regulator, cyclic AMP receptor protein